MSDNVVRKSYVYILYRPWNGIPCYVGKGVRNRWLDHERAGINHPNSHLAKIFAKVGGPLPKKKIQEGLTNDEAIALEISLIKSIGRADQRLGPLTNHTDGGEGSTGKIYSEESRLLMRMSHLGKKSTEEQKRKNGESHRGKKRSLIARENMKAAGLKRRGKKRKPLSQEHRNKLSLMFTGRFVKPEIGAKISAAKTGVKRAPFSVEHCAKTSATMKGRQKTPEHLAALKAAALRRRIEKLRAATLIPLHLSVGF
jgi:hypothetical protein